jgi:hypothetical protein
LHAYLYNIKRVRIAEKEFVGKELRMYGGGSFYRENRLKNKKIAITVVSY